MVRKTQTFCAATAALTLAASAASAAPAFYDLGTLGGTESVGYAVNDAGQVAGYSTSTDGRRFAFRYDGTPGAGGVMRDLGTLGGTSSIGYGINNAGQVAGAASTSGNAAQHAFRYDGT